MKVFIIVKINITLVNVQVSSHAYFKLQTI